MKKRRKYHSIAQIQSIISQLEHKTKQPPESSSTQSLDSCRNYKDLITLCNSLCIVFIQYELIQDCLDFLTKAILTDISLCKYGTVLDKFWQGRILTYNNLAFLYYKVDQLGDCLKFLYNAHELMQSIKESGGVAKHDLEAASNILTFVTLWKLRRYSQAGIYLELAGENLSLIAGGRRSLGFSDDNAQSLFGLLAVCMAGMTVGKEGSLKKAIMILEDCIGQLEDQQAVKTLIKNQIKELYLMKNANITGLASPTIDLSLESSNEDLLPKIPSAVLNSELKPSYDWLITKDFERIFFITCYMPFIAPNTPLIQISDLESRKGKILQNDNPEPLQTSKTQYQDYENDIDTPNILPKLSLPISLKRSNQSKNTTAFRKPNTIDKLSLKASTYYEKPSDYRYPSEPRGSSYWKTQILPHISTPHHAGKVLSYPNSGKKVRDNSKHHIMIEFNPTAGESIPVELIPVTTSRRKIRHIPNNGPLESYYIDIYG